MNVKKKKKIIINTICVTFFVALAGVVLFIGYLWMKDNTETVNEISDYETVLGSEGKYKKNLIAENNIFPDRIPEDTNVEEFCYKYYNPWDPNYLGYLVYSCDSDEYEKEYHRLKELQSTANYRDFYGIQSFRHELCAIYANEYGVIYALADEKQKRFIYVDLEFCNYFSDIQYKNVIDEAYLPEGFDATKSNGTRERLLEGNS